MKAKFIIASLTSFALVGAAIAKDPREVIVPFVYIGLGANQQLAASYTLQDNKRINCKENNGVGGFIAEWTHEGKKIRMNLPVILKASEEQDGNKADKSGVIYIQNISGSNRNFISCKFIK